MTREVEGAGNIVDDYLQRRGWSEKAMNKAYMAALRFSVISLNEASDIRPGEFFLARDLIRGGEPVWVSERTATHTLKPWDRIAARLVAVRGKTTLGGGLLPFDHELSESQSMRLARNGGSRRWKPISQALATQMLISPPSGATEPATDGHRPRRKRTVREPLPRPEVGFNAALSLVW